MNKKIILTFILVFALASFVSALDNCQDSDNGVNLETKGTLSLFYPNGSLYQDYEDECYDANQLDEYACGHPDAEDSIERRYTCPKGCLNGACIQEEKQTTCQDSDNGVNLQVKGTLSLFYSNGTLYQNYEDVCYDSSDIKEYACGHPSEPDSIDSRYTCPNGCENGKCVDLSVPSAICEDSDGGLNYFIRGLANSTDNGHGWDGCLDDNFQSNEVVHYNGSIIKAGTGTKVSEVYCDENNRFASKVVDCEFGCLAGACLKSAYLGEKAVTNIFNIENTPQTCSQICAKYGSKVAEKSCYDINFDKCTILSGNKCIPNTRFDEEDEPSELEYLVENDYSTSCCCENVVMGGCSSTDGINPFKKGRTTDSNGYVREDRCNDQVLEDYHCSEDGGTRFFSDFICPNGCEDGTCIPCNGCIAENKCFNFGSRLGDLFCSLEQGRFTEQLGEGLSCIDNYECKDNICIDNKCIGIGFWQKFINWFKRLFGAN